MSKLMARAAIAAHNQGRFWSLHDALFDVHNIKSTNDLRAVARAVGLDMARFEADLDAESTAQKVADQRYWCTSQGVQSSPAFLIGDEMVPHPRHADAYTMAIERQFAQRNVRPVIAGAPPTLPPDETRALRAIGEYAISDASRHEFLTSIGASAEEIAPYDKVEISLQPEFLVVEIDGRESVPAQRVGDARYVIGTPTMTIAFQFSTDTGNPRATGMTIQKDGGIMYLVPRATR